MDRLTRNSGRELSPFFKGLEDIFEEFFSPSLTSRQSFSPACDVQETDSHYLMSFDVPGVSKDDIKIELLDNRLTVSGERKYESENDRERGHHVRERYYGSFQRSFTLPTTVDEAKVEANFKDGVLEIAVPKAEAAKSREIRIGDGKAGLFSKLLGKKGEREAQDAH